MSAFHRDSNIPPPDFVLIGARLDQDLVALMASTTLDVVDLYTQYTDWEERNPFGPPPGVPRISLAVDMDNYVMATGRDYPEAMANLLGFWSMNPEDPQVRSVPWQQAVEEGRT